MVVEWSCRRQGPVASQVDGGREGRALKGARWSKHEACTTVGHSGPSRVWNESADSERERKRCKSGATWRKRAWNVTRIMASQSPPPRGVEATDVDNQVTQDETAVMGDGEAQEGVHVVKEEGEQGTMQVEDAQEGENDDQAVEHEGQEANVDGQADADQNDGAAPLEENVAADAGTVDQEGAEMQERGNAGSADTGKAEAGGAGYKRAIKMLPCRARSASRCLSGTLSLT